MDLTAQFARNSAILSKYVPAPAVPLLAQWIITYDFKLRITRERSTRYGDYSSPRNGGNHVITVNHNLNPYAFLITLVHEVAHLATYNRYRNTVNPHGAEWKQAFRELMQPFLSTDVFPLEVFAALRSYLRNPAASSCSDPHLLKTLKLHDAHTGKVFLEYLPAGTMFLYNGSRLFVKKEKLRKRFKCMEVCSGHVYLFDALAEVELFENLSASQAG
jgi:SprT protein